MDKAVSESVEMQLRSAFPAGTFTRVDVLGYGDDPDVEPGETAIRAFVDRAGHAAGSWEDDEKVLQSFEQAHGQETKKLHHAGLLPSVAWVQFIPDSAERRSQRGALYGFPSMFLGMRSDVADEAQGFASVRTRLGPADLSTVDARLQPRRGHAVGHQPHPGEPGLRPAPGTTARDRRAQGQVLAASRTRRLLPVATSRSSAALVLRHQLGSPDAGDRLDRGCCPGRGIRHRSGGDPGGNLRRRPAPALSSGCARDP